MTLYPDLSASKLIAVDIETYDPNLLTIGNGVYRRDGYILGISITTVEGFSEYYNLGHRNITQEEKTRNLEYCKKTLALQNDKVGANILYDLDWLENYQGLKVNGKIHDVQYAEPLLDEYAKSYSLNTLSKKYLETTKFTSEIDAFCKRNGFKGDSRQYLHKISYETVRKYAIVDAKNTLDIFSKQLIELDQQDLMRVYNMEIGLIPLLLQMRKNGVRIDKNKVINTKAQLIKELQHKENIFYKQYGIVNYKSTQQLSTAFKKLKIEVPTTEKGNSSLNEKVLKKLSFAYPICKEILEMKKLSRVVSAFFTNVLEKTPVNDRIHCTFQPLRSGDRGTVTGRFSSSDPNLQQVPAKDDAYGMECRSCFIPEETQKWIKLDYSQIEYRIIAHFAQGARSEEIRKAYNDNPNTDYHQMIMDWTGLDRKLAKNMNFGRAYFMGVKTCSEAFGWSMEESQSLLDKYDKEVPFVKHTGYEVIKVAKQRGYIKTFMGRRARVSEYIKQEKKEYVMFNRLIQGGAADIMKKGMVDSYNAGVFKALTPHITVHDELDISMPKTKLGFEAYRELKNIMENCIKIKVPIIVEAEIGNSWGSLRRIK